MLYSFPVYLGKNNRLRNLDLDFTITSSNRYIREYLFENQYRIHDALSTAALPILPDFPVNKEEGKIIMRTKILEELENLRKTLGMKGKIEDVKIHSMLAN